MRALRSALKAGLSIGALVLASGVGAPAASAAPSGLVWTLRWNAPTTEQGPNVATGAPSLSGTAAPALGRPDRVDATVSASNPLPAGCGSFPRAVPVELNGTAFVVRPDLACNGTYKVSVVAQVGVGMLASRSPSLQAPLTVIDAGGPVTGVTGAVSDGRTVGLSWISDPDPDVVGYRVSRNGAGLADVPADFRTLTDAPGPGTFRYDVIALRWGGGGPGSDVVASPPSGPFVARVVSDLPPSPSGTFPAPSSGLGTVAGGSPGSPTGTGGSTGAAGPLGSAAGPGGVFGRSTPALGGGGSKGRSSSGRSSSSGSVTGTTLDDGFAERLPYQAGSRSEPVVVPGRPATREISQSVRVPHGAGLLVPLGVVAMLLGGSILLRRLVQRAGAVAGAVADAAVADVA